MSAAPKLALVSEAAPAPIFPHDPTRRGYAVAYRDGETNRCPGCGRQQWYIGRIMAECAFCLTALPLAGNKEGDHAC